MNLKQVITHCNNSSRNANKLIHSGICQFCKDIFYCYYFGYGPRFCSVKCFMQRKAVLNRTVTKCYFCKKIVSRIRFKYERNKRNFCSLACFHKSMRGPGVGSITKHGYRVHGIMGKYVFEHRRIMENYLGRKLLPNEVVHHKNENKLDNRIKNLQIMSKNEHMKLHQHLRYPK